MSQGEELIRSLDEQTGVLTLTINREGRRNALSGEVVEGLTELIEQADNDDAVRVIVLTGAGERAFCAGGDLKGQMGGGGALGMHFARANYAELLLAMTRSARPIIARVNGQALGGGFGLMLSCDLAVVADDVRMGTPEIKVGLFPMMITAVIERNLGRKRMMELMLTGERVDAAKALEWGIVNRVVPREELDGATAELAERVASFSPAVLKLGRQAVYKTQDMAFEEALRSLHNELTINTLAEDAAEGIMAFMSKRDPEWKGR